MDPKKDVLTRLKHLRIVIGKFGLIEYMYFAVQRLFSALARTLIVMCFSSAILWFSLVECRLLKRDEYQFCHIGVDNDAVKINSAVL